MFLNDNLNNWKSKFHYQDNTGDEEYELQQNEKLRIIQICDSAWYHRALWVLLLCEGVWRVCLCLKVCYSHQRIKSCLAQLMLLPCRHGAEREPWRAEALQGGDLRAVQGEVCKNKCSRAQWDLGLELRYQCQREKIRNQHSAAQTVPAEGGCVRAPDLPAGL